MIWSALLWGYHFAAFNSILEVIGSANDKIGHISYTSCILIIGLMAIYWKRL